MAARKTEFTVDREGLKVVMKRIFDAPRRLVFEAMTKPELVARWYGPRGIDVASCEIDLRPGGAYRIVHRTPDGNQYGFKGVYREIVPPSRLVYTWIFEPMPDKESVVTDVFEEKDGVTTYTSTTAVSTLADLDGFVQSGATEGGAESMDRLEEVIRTLS
jgi:uncharacterized protein YndB with AHSA1/START domain